jgi:hypothetical protein
MGLVGWVAHTDRRVRPDLSAGLISNLMSALPISRNHDNSQHHCWLPSPQVYTLAGAMAPVTLQDIAYEPLGRPDIKPARLTEDPVAAAARRAALLAQIEQENAALAQQALNLPAWLLDVDDEDDDDEEMEEGGQEAGGAEVNGALQVQQAAQHNVPAWMLAEVEEDDEEGEGEGQQQELEEGEWVEGPQAAEVHDGGAEQQQEEEEEEVQ